MCALIFITCNKYNVQMLNYVKSEGHKQNLFVGIKLDDSALDDIYHVSIDTSMTQNLLFIEWPFLAYNSKINLCKQLQTFTLNVLMDFCPIYSNLKNSNVAW